MIAADTCSMVAFINGEEADDVEAIKSAIADELLILPPVVLSELLSAKSLKKEVADLLVEMPLVELADEFWVKVGEARRQILAKGRKARLADSMIAVCCIENSIPLITRDSDFRHYVEFGLKILP
jgi:predicted nucleic acid-binding protein